MNIKLVFYGENGELEYGGDKKNIDKPFKPISEWRENYFKGSKLNNTEISLYNPKYTLFEIYSG